MGRRLRVGGGTRRILRGFGTRRLASERLAARLLMEPTPDLATAYHEAGHAVMALALGRPVAAVTILPDRLRLGACEFGKAVFRPSEDWLEREALISLAGLAAEALHTGDYA